MNPEDLTDYLFKNNVTKNKDWYQKVLFTKISASCGHIIRMLKEVTIKDPRFFQLL